MAESRAQLSPSHFGDAGLPWLSRVQVRYLRKRDLRALEWEGQYKHFRRLYANTYRRATKGLAVLWVADLPGVGVIGQAFVQLHLEKRPHLADGKQRAYLHSFRVRPAFRRAGLGAKLLEAAEADLIRRGYSQVNLAVSKSNPDARRLYARYGYQVVGDDPGRWSYQDHRGVWRQVDDPSWRMSKMLVAPP